MTEDEKYLEKIRNEYQQIMEKFEEEEQEEKERFRHLAKNMGYHSRLRLDYNRWMEDCLNRKDWPGVCRLIEQEVKYDLIPCIYGGYTHESHIESTLEAFACGDTYTITAALPYKMGDIKNCYRPFYLAASNLLTALWYRDEEQIKDAVLAGEKFAARKTISQWERATVSFLMDLHIMDMEKASKDLLDVCKGYLRLKNTPIRPFCISAHGLYCLAQLLLPEEAFLALAMPEYKNFSKEFALWRREHLEPDLTPYFQYPSELDWLNCIYQTPPTKLLLHQMQIDNPAIPPKKRKEWTSDGVQMQKAFVEGVWENIQRKRQMPFQVEQLEHCLKLMVLLDIIMLPEEDSWLRLTSCCVMENVHKYIIDNGSGDTLTIWFTLDGVFIKGFDHENALNQFGAEEWNEDFFRYTYAGIPTEFRCLLTDEERDETTFCMWYVERENQWVQNEWNGNDGGKAYLLGYIQQSAQDWQDWASVYYEMSLDLSTIQKIYNNNAVACEDIKNLNPSRNVDAALQEINAFLDLI